MIHTQEMGLNDRLCMALKDRQEPYNIVRVVDMGPGFVTLYLSLLKREFRLSSGKKETIQTHLSGHIIHIEVVLYPGEVMDTMAVHFITSSPKVEFKPLRKKESYRAH